MADEGGEHKMEESSDKKVVHTYALVLQSDMNEELKSDAIEQVVTACEKNSQNPEAAARMIKELMDKKYGAPWHVVIGEGYGFDISYQVSNLLYMYFAGCLAICVWKCS